MTPAAVLALARCAAVTDIGTAAQAMGIGRSLAYRLAKERPEDLPFRVLRVGTLYRVPTADLLAALGLAPEPKPSAAGR